MAATHLLSTSEVAARLGVTRATILNRIEAGTIVPAAIVGASGKRIAYVFAVEDVDRLAAARAAELTAEAARLTGEGAR